MNSEKIESSEKEFMDLDDEEFIEEAWKLREKIFDFIEGSNPKVPFFVFIELLAFIVSTTVQDPIYCCDSISESFLKLKRDILEMQNSGVRNE